jgi:hypothetical protein
LTVADEGPSVLVLPRGETFKNGMPLEARHFHLEWTLRHRAHADAHGALSGGPAGLVIAPGKGADFDPVAKVGGQYVLKAEARVLMPWGVVLELEKDHPLTVAPEKTAYLQCKFDAASEHRYWVSVETKEAAGNDVCYVRIAPEPVVYHLRATPAGREATTGLMTALRDYAVALRQPGDGSPSRAAKLAAAVTALAAVEPAGAAVTPLDGFVRAVELLDDPLSAAAPRAPWTAAGIARLAKDVRGWTAGVQRFPAAVQLSDADPADVCAPCQDNAAPTGGRALYSLAVVGPPRAAPDALPVSFGDIEFQFARDRAIEARHPGFGVYTATTAIRQGAAIPNGWKPFADPGIVPFRLYAKPAA